MTRTACVTAIVLGVLALARPASAKDADEVVKLKREIELLKKENDLLARENALLKRENEQLKAGGAKGAAAKPTDDGFGVGAKLVGTVTRSWVAGGKPRVVGDDAEFEITKRSGTEFTAELWADNRKVGNEVEGTIETNGVVRFKTTKSLTDRTVNLVGVHTFTGRLDKGVLTGRTTKKGDPSYKGAWKLKLKKE